MVIVKIKDKVGGVKYPSENKLYYKNNIVGGIQRCLNLVLLENGKLKACFDSDMEVIDSIDDKILQQIS